jgi:ketosteroid isomerase-like protein
MSQENIEVVLDMFRAFRERDDDAIFRRYAPDIEWDLRGYSPWAEEQLFRGRDGIREFFRKWLEDFEEFTSTARDPVDVGEQVVVTVTDSARGKRSGAPLGRVTAHVWTFRDGKVARIQIFDSRTDALEAVGLEE